MRALEIAGGLVYASKPFQSLRAKRFSDTSAPCNLRAAVLVHVFYPEVWDEILAVLDSLPAGAPIIVTAPRHQAAEIAALAKGNPLVEIVETPNRGRDIAPFLQVLQSGQLDRFDAVLKIHTKKSPHLRQGNLRRRVLFTALAGSSGVVSRVLKQFLDPNVGMVGPSIYFRTAPVYWMDNRRRVEELAARMGTVGKLGFFEGSMFWFRPAAFAPLRSLALTGADFEEEAAQLDATFHHAIERVFPLTAAAAGFETRSLGGKTLWPAAGFADRP
ncbi:rhamnan synthesis F family protein [Bosea sp. ASV33]|uniref:rhamnan synthesis F family protein n=1 Tax=Bosea sp. ASV33 TaxID=2795106 RepID=UPI0018EC57C4|nr:rhamnan synthesis F family protein [Bosea sp. ASV33]